VCGIIGYSGFREVKEILIEGLKKLEYRGYDSAGISIINENLKIYKEIGDIGKLVNKIPNLKGNIGIGHTRWATHGKVNKINAHPQISCNNKIAVVHNGVIENFEILRDKLKSKGHKFKSKTDTEVITHLIENYYKGNLEDAVFSALEQIKGSYAIVVLCEDEPEKIVGVRNENPLIIGIGDNENFIASDVPAILDYTNRVMYLEDGDTAVITKTGIKVRSNGKTVERKEHTILWNLERKYYG